MEFIGTSKIGKLSVKGFDYPQLRLPKSCSRAIGDLANIFETEYGGKQAFLIVTEKDMSNSDMVLKPSSKVLKPKAEIAAEARLSSLESEISDLKSMLILNEGASLREIQLRWARPDSDRRSPPCQGDVITT